MVGGRTISHSPPLRVSLALQPTSACAAMSEWPFSACARCAASSSSAWACGSSTKTLDAIGPEFMHLYCASLSVFINATAIKGIRLNSRQHGLDIKGQSVHLDLCQEI